MWNAIGCCYRFFCHFCVSTSVLTPTRLVRNLSDAKHILKQFKNKPNECALNAKQMLNNEKSSFFHFYFRFWFHENLSFRLLFFVIAAADTGIRWFCLIRAYIEYEMNKSERQKRKHFNNFLWLFLFSSFTFMFLDFLCRAHDAFETRKLSVQQNQKNIILTRFFSNKVKTVHLVCHLKLKCEYLSNRNGIK